MTIQSIVEIKNPDQSKLPPIKENQDIFIPGIINQNISRRNGGLYCICGSGGSGKSSMMLNQFRDKNSYKKVFDNIYYFNPEGSFNSVKKHPFEKHDKVYHTLDIETLQMVYEELLSKKKEATKKKEKKTKAYESESESEEEEEKHEIEYSCIVIDDFADELKNKNLQNYLNKFIIKLRHLCCKLIITLQSYYYLPKLIRKQITYLVLFKSKNTEEFQSISKELMNLNKEDSLTLYNYIFDQPYTHLDIDLSNHTYYKNFNKLQIQN